MTAAEREFNEWIDANCSTRVPLLAKGYFWEKLRSGHVVKIVDDGASGVLVCLPKKLKFVPASEGTPKDLDDWLKSAPEFKAKPPEDEPNTGDKTAPGE